MPAAEVEYLTPDIELVPLTLGQVLYESGETMSHAYFPIYCVISLLYVMKNGKSVEIAVVGNDGMVGIGKFMGPGRGIGVNCDLKNNASYFVTKLIHRDENYA